MWTSLSLPWQVCLEEAWKAYCSGTVPIGAVIVDPGGKVIARGRNRIRDHAHEPPYLSGITLAHAEVNALLAFDYHTTGIHDCTLYTTTEPCPLCMGAFYMSGIRGLCYASRDPYAGSTDMLGATPYLNRKPVRCSGPERDDLEGVVMAMAVEQILKTGRTVLDEPLPTWKVVLPAAVEAGCQLYASRLLYELAAHRASAQQAIDQVAALLPVARR